jgi:SAM-dependent methyltransferase
MAEDLDAILKEQKAYYEARAQEYDDWFYRRGRYDRGPAHTRQWQAEIEEVRHALRMANLSGHIVDIAAGTGIWTQELLNIADHITALDSSEEMMELNAKIAEKFNYFKALIHSGECTFDFIKNSVLAKNGPYPHTKFNIDSINTQSFEKEEELDPTEIPYDPTKSLIEKLVSSLFPGSTIEKVEQKKIKEIPAHTPVIKATKATKSTEEKPKKKSNKK